MKMKIQTTNFDIVSNGCVIVPYGEYVQFDIEGLSFRLMFESNTENLSAHIKHVIEKDSKGAPYMALHAYNFKGSLLNTITNSIELAKLEDRSLSLRLSISSVNKREEEVNGTRTSKEDMMVYYTWYLRKVEL